MRANLESKGVTLVVLGCGFQPTDRRIFVPSCDQYMAISNTAKLRALAAARRLKQGDIEGVIFSGGFTGNIPAQGNFPFQQWISEARGMRDYALNFAGNDPNVARLLREADLEEESDSTSKNAKKVAGMIDPSAPVELMTSASHLLRALRLFREFGVNATGRAAELVAWQNPEYRRIVRACSTQPGIATALAVEVVSNILLFPDPRGEWLDSYTAQRINVAS